VVCLRSSLLHRSGCVRSAKQPVTKTCLQCGAILPSAASACRFCESHYPSKLPVPDGASVLSPCVEGRSVSSHGDFSAGMDSIQLAAEERPGHMSEEPPEIEEVRLSTWRGELSNRLEAYRVRRKRISPNAAQPNLPFAEPPRAAVSVPTVRPAVNAVAAGAGSSRLAVSSAAATTSVAANVADVEATVSYSAASITSAGDAPIPKAPTNPLVMNFEEASVAVEELKAQTAARDEDFSFTIAIGRIKSRADDSDGRLMIDVSEEAREETLAVGPAGTARASGSLDFRQKTYPVAPMAERRLAGAIDLACLLFTCGAFLALFGSLGGHFTFSKLNAALCLAGFVIVYVQYFALFTVFGGTTPGMMLRGLQVMSFSGEPPTAREMALRSVGYALSAGTCFMGFLWSIWDEDELTWHDRFSHTYLSSAETYAEAEARSAVHPH
jgi:uncharacterized RDD family membrane protein YckC